MDLVLVHARPAEEEFVNEGHGEKRYSVMFNDFVIVGPTDDPAGIGQADNASQALQRIAAKQAMFISRGDDSGTHKKEKGLWSDTGIKPEGSWYREAGQGMGKVLQIAGELNGYTLTDRGTWLAFMDKSPLKIRFEGDEKLYNPYGIIAVSPKRYPDINHEGAMALIRWVTSETGQRKIGGFTIAGRRLFKPAADPDEIAVLQQAERGNNTH